MKRLLPQPLISAGLFVTWVLLYGSVSPVVLVGALLLAVGLPLLTNAFWPEYPHAIRVRPLLRLSLTVVYDIIVANLRMVTLILGPQRRLNPHFIVVPVTLQDPLAITLLASIISLTPGTVSANLSGDRRSLLVHDLNTDDPEAAARRITSRYELPLREIFE